MKLPPHIEAIRDKWIAQDFDADGKPFLGVVNADVSVLLCEIADLMREIEGLKGQRNGKPMEGER